MKYTNTEILTTSNISNLIAGTLLKVEGRKNPIRAVGTETINGRLYVSTTCGRQRPGSIAGGCISIFRDVLVYAPTAKMNTIMRPHIEILGLAC